jgi:uracil-DNA glycosylase family 4
MSLQDEIRKCRKCGITQCKPLVMGDIENSRFIFISEEPTREARDTEDFYSEYLGNRNERFHNEWMPQLGIDEIWLKKKAYITHVYKCCSELNKKPDRDRVCSPCIQWLDKEKEQFANKTIITFGDYSFSCLMRVRRGGFENKFKKWKYELGDNTVYSLPHPSNINIRFINKNRKLINSCIEILKSAISKY